MKKLLALLLAMIMVMSMLALASCGGKDDDDDKDEGKTEETEKGKKTEDEEETEEEPEDDPAEMIIGKWEIENADEFVLMVLGADEEAAKYFEDIELPVLFEFTKKGEMKGVVDEDKVEDFAVALMKGMIWAMAVEEAEEDLTWKEVLEEMETTEDELIESYMEEMDMDELVEEFSGDSEYEFDGDTLYIDDEEVDYEITSKKLVLDMDGFELELKKAK